MFRPNTADLNCMLLITNHEYGGPRGGPLNSELLKLTENIISRNCFLYVYLFEEQDPATLFVTVFRNLLL
jgi:hypothetical protein